jgi:4-hydroxybenzoate polyprenyltransferase
VHFVLGAVDAFAPLGAFIAIAGTVTIPALLLFVAVTVWVAGFDILYALMDYRYDVEQGLNSVPARFGERVGRVLPVALHVTMTLALLAAGVLAGAGFIYYAGVGLAALLVIYEERLIAFAKDVFVLNDRIFVTNMAFSVAFLGTTLASFMLAR